MMDIEKIKLIQDNLLKNVEPIVEKWEDKHFYYCPVCGNKVRLEEYDI